MEQSRRVAYRHLLYQAMLDIRGLEWLKAEPSDMGDVVQQANRAGAIAYWLHNLALASAQDFASFDEDAFWSQHVRLMERYPGVADHYREVFDREMGKHGGSEGEETLTPEVQDEAGAIVADLSAAGWTVTASHYDEQHFGNWYVDLTRGERTIRLVKDRSQFMVDAPIEELKAAGLFKAFDELGTFRQAVVAWATRP